MRPICSVDSYHVDHAYVTALVDVADLSAAGYQYDGIEGYAFPASSSQPAGTTTLIRGRNLANDDFALFPEEERSAMTSAGYTDSVVTVGFAYLNSDGSRPTY